MSIAVRAYANGDDALIAGAQSPKSLARFRLSCRVNQAAIP